MNPDLTDLTLVVDRSGSMATVRPTPNTASMRSSPNR